MEPLTMTTETQVQTSEIVTAFLSVWTDALSAGDFKALSELFDESALFAATGPHPLQGRSQIQTYYEQAPQGLCVRTSVLFATRPVPDLVHALAEVAFEAPGGVSLQGRLGLSLIRSPQGWRVSFYQLTANRPATV
jgi:ketosteroid isomerase-like protein